MRTISFACTALLLIAFAGCKATQTDEATPIGIAVAKAQNGACEMHIVVSMGFPRRQGPKLEGGVQNWNKWIDEHFEVREVGGGRIPLRRANFSSIISEAQAMNPEFYLAASVKPGKKYIFDYIPVLEEKTRLRQELSIPEEGLPFARYNCAPAR